MSDQVTVNTPLSIKDIVATSFREMGKDRYELRREVKQLKADLDKAVASRARLVETMATLSQVLGLPYPAPDKIIQAVKALTKGST